MTCPTLPADLGTTISNDTFICQQQLLKRWGCGSLPTVQISPMPIQVAIYIVA
jgi:hypothetical protein